MNINRSQFLINVEESRRKIHKHFIGLISILVDSLVIVSVIYTYGW